MNASLFLEYIDKYFRPVITKITEKFNGKSTDQTLLHKTMLTEEYSADLNWGATEINHSIVAADVVSMDSSLPLKSRSTISKATGLIPKIGVKFRKGEKDISDINTMIAKGADEATIASKVFDDSVKAIKAVEVRKEIMFLTALSTGSVLVADGSEDAGNQGTGPRELWIQGREHLRRNRAAVGNYWLRSAGRRAATVRQGFRRRQQHSPRVPIEEVFRPVPTQRTRQAPRGHLSQPRHH